MQQAEVAALRETDRRRQAQMENSFEVLKILENSFEVLNISVADWDAQIAFWSDPKNVARCAQNARNRAKSTVICRLGSRSLVVLRDRQMESSTTREYPSLIQTYFDTHTVDGIFLRDEERLLYSQHEVGSGIGSGEGEDDEPGDDKDAGEEEEDKDEDS
ncbi:UDP-glycosyltransferase 86A1 [Tanacetum coccineum]